MGWWIFATILGLPLGVGLSLYITSNMLDKSNNFGDSKGDIRNFSRGGLMGKNFKDRVSKSIAFDPIQNPTILEHMKLDSGKNSIFGQSEENI